MPLRVADVRGSWGSIYLRYEANILLAEQSNLYATLSKMSSPAHPSLGALRDWSRRLKRDILALSLAMADPRTPWAVRLLGALVLAYAASPIDLVPDFIPILGYFDDPRRKA